MRNRNTKRLVNTSLWAGFLLAALCGLYLALPGDARALGDEGDDFRVTVEFDNVSVVEALETLATLTGRPIELMESTGDRRVSFSLRNVTLEESLERLFQGSSHVIVWGPGDRVSIRELEDTPQGIEATSGGAQGPSGEGDDTALWYPADEADVLPPSAPGEHPVTLEDLELIGAVSAAHSTDELEILPVLESESMVMTEGDLEILRQNQAARGDDVEVLPPDNEGSAGLTLRELEAMRSTRSSLTSSQIEVLPPNQLGEIGLTLEELQALNQARTSHQPLPLNDMILPE